MNIQATVLMLTISILMLSAHGTANEANGSNAHLNEETRDPLIPKGCDLGMSVGKLRGLGMQLLRASREDFDRGRYSEKRASDKQEVYIESNKEANTETVYRTYIFNSDKCECIAVGKRVIKAQYAQSVIQDVNSLAEMYGYDAPKRRIKKDMLYKQLRPCLIWHMEDREVVLDWTSEKEVAESGKYGTIQVLIRSHNFGGSRFTESDLYKKCFSPVGDNDELFHVSGSVPSTIKQLVKPMEKATEDTTEYE